MAGDFLLDTNIVVALFGGDSEIRNRMVQDPRVMLSVTVLGELYYGAHKSARVDENLKQIARFLSLTVVVAFDADTAREYGAVRNELRVKGRPIPENDIWLAAIARQHSLILVSRDQHFAHVEGIAWEQW